MKFNVRSFALGVLVGSLGLTTAFAAPVTKQLNAAFSINGITVDGKAIQFEEASRPFTVEGHTYLPLRVIAEALDKNVVYDSKTATIAITGKDGLQTSEPSPEAFDSLTKEMVTGAPKGLSIWGVREWDAAMKDNAGRTHKTGIRFATSLYDLDRKSDVYPTETAIDIGLLGTYTKFEGWLALTENSKRLYNTYTITISADGKEIQRLENVKTGTVPVELELDVSKVKQLTFKFESTSSNILSETVEYGIVDVKLYR